MEGYMEIEERMKKKERGSLIWRVRERERERVSHVHAYEMDMAFPIIIIITALLKTFSLLPWTKKILKASF
jgi:hypothetical protein